MVARGAALRRECRLVAADIEIPRMDGPPLSGAVARPATPGPHPGVVVIHEAFGDQPEIRAVCDSFAERRYVAVMPDLFSSGGPRAICAARSLMEASTGRPGRVTGLIEAARVWLASQDDVDRERIAVIGFCMGGAFALAFAAEQRPGIRAASVNYGDVPKDPERLRGTCPVVASYGRRDKIIGPRAKRLRSHLEQLGVEHDVKIYDDAGHSFLTQGRHPLPQLLFVPMALGYVEDAADDAWGRIFSFFERQLGPA
jgi:carboxymethylenebutenolidase